MTGGHGQTAWRFVTKRPFGQLMGAALRLARQYHRQRFTNRRKSLNCISHPFVEVGSSELLKQLKLNGTLSSPPEISNTTSAKRSASVTLGRAFRFASDLLSRCHAVRTPGILCFWEPVLLCCWDAVDKAIRQLPITRNWDLVKFPNLLLSRRKYILYTTQYSNLTK